MVSCKGVIGNRMSKLFKLKEWLTISDAAKHISSAINEPVLEADILQLALDKHLKLSVHLVNGAYARKCTVVDIFDVEYDEVPTLDGLGTINIPKNGRLFTKDGEILQVQKDVIELSAGVWNLPLCGGERVDVEYQFQQLTDQINVTAVSLDGVFVCTRDGELRELQAHYNDNEFIDKSTLKKPFNNNENFHPAGGLPEDSIFVVRTTAIVEFLKSIENAPEQTEKPLGNRERDTLLTIIAVLCKDARLDYSKSAKTAGSIQRSADDMNISIGETTIEGHLKKIPNALATRMK